MSAFWGWVVAVVFLAFIAFPVVIFLWALWQAVRRLRGAVES